MTLFAIFAFYLCCKSTLAASTVTNLIASFCVFVVEPTFKIGKAKFTNRWRVVACCCVKMLNAFNTSNCSIIGRVAWLMSRMIDKPLMCRLLSGENQIRLSC